MLHKMVLIWGLWMRYNSNESYSNVRSPVTGAVYLPLFCQAEFGPLFSSVFTSSAVTVRIESV